MADPATETTDPGNGKIFSSRNLVENIGQKSWQSEKFFEVADKVIYPKHTVFLQ